MFVVSSRNTELGARHIFDAMQAEESAKRMAAQRAAWEAEIAANEATVQRRQDALDKSRAMLAELRAQGLKYRPTFRTIEIKAVRLFHVTPGELRGNCRRREIVFARQFVMYWALRLTKLSLPQVGRLLGGRDHTTCLHGERAYAMKRARMARTLRLGRDALSKARHQGDAGGGNG